MIIIFFFVTIFCIRIAFSPKILYTPQICHIPFCIVQKEGVLRAEQAVARRAMECHEQKQRIMQAMAVAEQVKAHSLGAANTTAEANLLL